MSSIRFYSHLIIIVFVSFTVAELRAQCVPPAEIPTVECENAPVTCFRGACYTTSNEPAQCCPSFCGPNTLIHNPQYFEIIPIADCIEIQVEIGDCSNFQGLQAALVTSCEWVPCPAGSIPCADILDCDPGTFTGGTMIMDACNLTPGVPLWLVIDGSNAAICEYTISFLEGIYEPLITDSITAGEAIPAEACQGYNDLILSVSPGIQFAHGYFWELEWSGEVLISNQPQIEVAIPDDSQPGTWNVCVQAFSGCDTTEVPFCFPVEIYSIDSVLKDSVTFCHEIFPFEWHEVTITGPGTYTQTFMTPEGCLFDSTWVVQEYPEVQTGTLTIIECLDPELNPFVFEGETYESSGEYLVSYPGAGLNGCDSFLLLDLVLEGIRGFVEYDCVEGQTFLEPQIIDSMRSADSITYEWYDCGFEALISTSRNLSIDSSGCYCVVINTGFCQDTICSTYTGDPCATGCQIAEGPSCIGDSVLYYFDQGDTTILSYHWLIETRNLEHIYFTGNDSIWIAYDSTGCFRVSLTTVTDSMTMTCIDSICIEAPSTEVEVCCNHITCEQNTELTLSLTGTPPWTVILSDGTVIDTISGIMTSPYVHPIFVYQPTTTYTIIDAFGTGDLCDASIVADSIQIEYINPWPCPDCPVIIQSDSVLCTSEDVIALAWYACNDSLILSTAQCFTAASSGCYCVEFTVSDTCDSLFTCMDIIVATEQPDRDLQLSVWPNPAHDLITVKLPEDLILPVNWQLYDCFGVEVQKGLIRDYHSELTIAATFPSGLYFLQIQTDKGIRWTKKLIVEK